MDILQGQKKVGEVIGDTYYTHREPKHFMRMFQGFGISESILERLQNLGVIWVMIDYEGTEGLVKYKCKLSKFMISFKEYTFTDPFNRFGSGVDVQKFVAAREMAIFTLGHWNDEPKKREVQQGLKFDN